MELRRVVVTGMGIVSPLGVGIDHVWARLLKGDSGIKEIDTFDCSDLPCKIAGYVPIGEAPGQLNPEAIMQEKERRKIDEFILFGVAAADEALANSGWAPETDEQRCRSGVLMGSGIGGLHSIDHYGRVLDVKGPRRVSPFMIPSVLINLISGQVSMRHGLKGPNHSVVTACSSGAHAIGDAARLIALDDADVMVAGSAEMAITRLGITGFAAARALSTKYNDAPTTASRPWDQGRDGFVMGAGSGALVLESLDHAKARGANIIAEVVGYGLSGDAHHITAPAPDGNGGFRSMQAALKRAGLTAEDIDYVNAHGTSTPLGDEIELNAVKRLLGNNAKNISMSSTKSAIGHLLGGAGSVEAIFSILAIRDQIVPPTLNLNDPTPEAEGMDLVPHTAKERRVRAALSNSFGFGGTNASLVVKEYTGD